MELKERVIVVTGAGQGLGKQFGPGLCIRGSKARVGGSQS